ncbi:hypothetical protein BXZ70DRAFT_1003504 [Cristinia sonorae]|uniref:Uncharacterized protein n=1 Tax=Cristinia sonorae TaxID=1940300 RepID=A0A8K0UYB7_9AGAR|nr:hypothetical protein BXZ70DRAFT_1003504 [Cristinia sonorae]
MTLPGLPLRLTLPPIQSDWAPPVVPALWGRLPDEHATEAPPPQYHEVHHEEKHHEEKKNDKPWDDHQNQSQQVIIPHEEQKKKWYDLTPERKKQLAIGGGLLAGAAALGAGYAVYKHSQKSEEEKQADVWSLQSWLKDAQWRTEKYHKEGPKGPVTWILVNGKDIPKHAIKGGEENGELLYISRFYIDGSIQVGKASPRFEKGALVGYGGEEIAQSTYEILIGDIRALQWVDYRGQFDINKLNGRPVEGGNEADGTPLYIIQARFQGGVHPGKVSSKLGGGMVSWGGGEHQVDEYHVLCYH